MVEFEVMNGCDPYTILEFDRMQLKCPRSSCFTCKHCEDFIWDYTHGPYLILCNLNQSLHSKIDIDIGILGYCRKYEDDRINREVFNHDN